jgi:hypothetical protein
MTTLVISTFNKTQGDQVTEDMIDRKCSTNGENSKHMRFFTRQSKGDVTDGRISYKTIDKELGFSRVK